MLPDLRPVEIRTRIIAIATAWRGLLRAVRQPMSDVDGGDRLRPRLSPCHDGGSEQVAHGSEQASRRPRITIGVLAAALVITVGASVWSMSIFFDRAHARSSPAAVLPSCGRHHRRWLDTRRRGDEPGASAVRERLPGRAAGRGAPARRR